MLVATSIEVNANELVGVVNAVNARSHRPRKVNRGVNTIGQKEAVVTRLIAIVSHDLAGVVDTERERAPRARIVDGGVFPLAQQEATGVAEFGSLVLSNNLAM